MASNTPEKLWRLIQKLAEKTDQGVVAWEQTPAKNTFQTSFPNYSVIMSEVPGTEEDGLEDILIKIVDEDGQVIETTSDVDLRKSSSEDAYQVMRRLFQAARRQALGVDEAIDNILQSLQD